MPFILYTLYSLVFCIFFLHIVKICKIRYKKKKGYEYTYHPFDQPSETRQQQHGDATNGKNHEYSPQLYLQKKHSKNHMSFAQPKVNSQIHANQLWFLMGAKKEQIHNYLHLIPITKENMQTHI